MAKTSSKKKRRRVPKKVTKPGPASAQTEGWCLEATVAEDRGFKRISIDRFPFRIGRRKDVELTLSPDSISAYHAELYVSAATGKLCVRDMESTNGTFVNHQQVHDAVLKSGDLLHLADLEFVVRRVASGFSYDALAVPKQTLQLGKSALSKSGEDGTRELLELIREKSITPLFQPIVRLPNGEVDGYEVLSRGRHPGLTDNPSELLEIAARLGLAPELSRLFRNIALEAIGDRDDLPVLFLNTHPDELSENRSDFVAELRSLVPRQALVLEIHETALADPDSIRDLQHLLSEHGIGLAFDDFGAGQARVVQLAEVPPDYLKFDRTFVCGIDSATASKRHVLSSIVATARDLGAQTVAEGIETEDEAEACAQIGFSHAQGFFFGRPIPLEQI